MKKRILALFLALALCLGLTPATAYTNSDFSDVPRGHWAYDYVMEMADKGLIKGTGGGRFDPNTEISAAMLLTLLGRVAFPCVTVGPGDTWYGPYVRKAEECGWLAASAVTADRVTEPISRYDMAAILSAAAGYLGLTGEKDAWVSFADKASIPGLYRDAVGLVCSMGLITGDGNFRFNGWSTMTRAQAATVLSRLVKQVDAPAPDVGTDDPVPPPPPEDGTDDPAPPPAPAEGDAQSPALEDGQAVLTIDGTECPMEALYRPNGGVPVVHIYYRGQTGLEMPFLMMSLKDDFAPEATVERTFTLTYWDKWVPADEQRNGDYRYGHTETGTVHIHTYDPTQATASLFYLDCAALDKTGGSHTIRGWVKVAVPGKVSSDSAATPGTTPGVVLTPQPCPSCGFRSPGRCRPCNGTGQVRALSSYTQCSACLGTGRCRVCGGDGLVYD